MDRKKKYVPPEDPAEILKVSLSIEGFFTHVLRFAPKNDDSVAEQKMQERLASEDPAASQSDRLQFIPTPGQHRKAPVELASMPREQLLKELTSLRESEKWTGLDFSAQKAAVKAHLRNLR